MYDWEGDDSEEYNSKLRFLTNLKLSQDSRELDEYEKGDTERCVAKAARAQFNKRNPIWAMDNTHDAIGEPHDFIRWYALILEWAAPEGSVNDRYISHSRGASSAVPDCLVQCPECEDVYWKDWALVFFDHLGVNIEINKLAQPCGMCRDGL